MSRLGTSLVARLVAGVVLVALAVGFVGAIVIRNSARDALRTEIEEENRAAAQRLAAELDARVGALEDSLRLLASRGDLAALTPDPTELAVALRAIRSFDSLVLMDGEGRTVTAVAARRLVDASEIPPDRQVVEALEPGEPASRVVGDGHPMIEVVAPVENPPGTVVGAVVGVASFEIVAQGVQAGFVGRTAVAFVVSEDGEVLVHPERQRVVRNQQYDLERVLAPEENRAVILERGGEEFLAAGAPAARLPVVVVLEEASAEVFGRVDDEVAELTAFLALTVGAIVVVLGLVATRLLRPLAQLARTVRRIGQGDHAARAGVTGTGEVRVVAEEVNRMAEALERRLSELEAAHREMEAAEARFRTAFDQAPVAMAIVAHDGHYEQVNPAMTAMLGRSEDELLSLTWRDITHPDDLADSERVFETARASGTRSYRLEKRYLHGDGHPVWVLVSVGFVRTALGTSSMVTHIQDISKQRQAQEEREALLRHALAAEERTNRVLESAPDATLVVLPDGRIAYANRKTVEMFGYEPTELVDQDVELLLPERFRDRHRGHRAAFVASPKARPMGAGLALWGRRKDGTEFPVEVSLSPLTIDEETRVVASVRDVTERLRAEATSRALDAMRTRQRQAVELNDNIVQGLTVAKWAFERQRLEEARTAVERTLEAARALIQDMLREASAMDLAPGDLVRQRPADLNT